MSASNRSTYLIVILSIILFFPYNYFLQLIQNKNDYPSVEKLLELNNYHSIYYNILTEDGYFITLQRIVPKNYDTKVDRKPVIIVSGMFASSNVFIFKPPHMLTNGTGCTNIVFCLLETGRYDVWIPNLRGTHLSGKHIQYDQKDPKYWDFSFEDMAIYDLPAVIDYIKKVTGTKHKIAMLGYSMGGTIQHIFMTMKPEYSSQIHPYISWSPAIYLNKSNVMLDFVVDMPWIPWVSLTKQVVSMLRHEIRHLYFKYISFDMIEKLLTGSIGENSNYNKSLLPYYLELASPSGELSNVLDHFYSMMLTKKFVQYHANKHLHPHRDPPEAFKEYSWSTIPKNLTFVVMYGNTDLLVTRDDSERIVSNLRQHGVNAILYRIKSPSWNHINFVTGNDAAKLVVDPTVRFFDKFYD